MPDAKVRAVYCRYHCTACDRHFTSLVAFDRHRRDRKGRRECFPPREVNKAGDKKVLGIQTTEGACRHTRNPDGPGLLENLTEVTLWEAV